MGIGPRIAYRLEWRICAWCQIMTQKAVALWVGRGKGSETIDRFFNERVSKGRKTCTLQASCDIGRTWVLKDELEHVRNYRYRVSAEKFLKSRIIAALQAVSSQFYWLGNPDIAKTLKYAWRKSFSKLIFVIQMRLLRLVFAQRLVVAIPNTTFDPSRPAFKVIPNERLTPARFPTYHTAPYYLF